MTEQSQNARIILAVSVAVKKGPFGAFGAEIARSLPG
jgi:hypothetical protein